MTIRESLYLGYTHAAKEDHLIKISEWDGETPGYFLIEKKGKSYTIDESLIETLITEYLSEQDEVGDEEGILIEAAEKVDYSDIASKLNEAFSVYKWCEPTEIELTSGTYISRSEFYRMFSHVSFEVAYLTSEGVSFRGVSDDDLLSVFVNFSDISNTIFPNELHYLEDLNITYGFVEDQFGVKFEYENKS